MMYEEYKHKNEKEYDWLYELNIPVSLHLEHGAGHPPLQASHEGEGEVGRLHLEAWRRVRTFNIHRQL